MTGTAEDMVIRTGEGTMIRTGEGMMSRTAEGTVASKSSIRRMTHRDLMSE